MERELLQSPMISYRSLLYNTTVLYDIMINMVCNIIPITDVLYRMQQECLVNRRIKIGW